MLKQRRFHGMGLAALAGMLGLGLMAHAALAGEPPHVDPGSALMVLDPYGSGYANMRAAPDPRSEATGRILTGFRDLHPTGHTALYGDTWWIEVKPGTITGWLNARLVADAQTRVPLQIFINIDVLQPVADYAFAEAPSRESTTTSYDECARICVPDAQCQGIQYDRATSKCGVFEERPSVRKRDGQTVALKPSLVPEGGWFANTSSRFDKAKDFAVEGDSIRDRITHSADECALTCSLETQCTAYTYQRKKSLCSQFASVMKPVARPGTDVGTRIQEHDIVDASALPTAPTSEPTVALLAPLAAALNDTGLFATSANAAAAPPPDLAAINVEGARLGPLVRQFTEDAELTAAFATSDISRSGRVRVKPQAFVNARNTASQDGTRQDGAKQPGDVGQNVLLAAAPGDRATRGVGGGIAVPQAGLNGNVYNLAPLLDPDKPDVVHLVFYAQPAAPPVVLATASHDTPTAAIAAALKMQRDLDDIAKLAGLGADPLALLKPMRR